VKTETVQLSNFLPTLIRNVGKSWNVSTYRDCADSFSKGELGDIFCVACATIGNPNPSCRWSQKREACFLLVLFADVVFVGLRVVCQHDIRGGSGIE
jgi:hypothetical protein